MARTNVHVVITAGSHTATDFWPFSRRHLAKQFLDLLGTGRSLLQITYERSRNLTPPSNIWVVVEKDVVSLVKEQLPDLPNDQILPEPVRRGTASGVAYAAHKISKKDPDAVMVVSPTEHAIFGEMAFVRDINKAVDLVTNDAQKLLIIGIKPTYPSTSYPYVQYHYDRPGPAKKVKTLTDKPQTELAKLFLNSGDFVWNTGIFVWRVRAILDAYRQHLPGVAEVFAPGDPHYFTDQEELFISQAYAHCKSTSLNNHLLEKADSVYMMLGNFDWSDVNSWGSLFDLKDKRGDENTVEANALLFESKGNYIKSENDKLLVVHSLDDFLVANSDDVLLICPKHLAEKLKDVVSEAKAKKGDRYV
ncbi:MAG: sugar phosphate nucleotidyltransferase [Tunicatimonas sp.]